MTTLRPLCLALACLPAALIHAQSTWDGETSGNWETGSNWDPDGIPTSTDDTLFNDPFAVPNQPDTTGGGPDVQVASVTLNQAGWVISGNDQLKMFGEGTPLSSIGAGVNRIDAAVDIAGQTAAVNFFTGTGNILVFGANTAFGSGDQQVNKTGDGTWVIDSGANLGFVVDSDINAGKLLINGTYNNNDFGHTLEINAGATLGGVGSMNTTNRSFYNINSGAALNPGGDGTFGSQIGTFSIDNTRGGNGVDRDTTLTFFTGSQYQVDINALSADSLFMDKTGTDPTTEVRLIIESGVELALFGTPAATSYDLISLVGLDTVYDGSPFSTVTLNGVPLAEDEDYSISYTAVTKGDPTTGGVAFTYLIPEPSVYAALIGLIALGVAGYRRRGASPLNNCTPSA